MRPNSPPQTTRVLSSRPRAFKSVSRPAIGLSTARALFWWPRLQTGVLVPAVGAHVGTKQLDESYAALDQTPGDQAFPREDLCRHVGIVKPVKLLGRRRFAAQTHELGDGRLACGKPTRSWRSPPPGRRGGPCVPRPPGRACGADRASALKLGCRLSRRDVGHRRGRRLEDRSLIRRGQEAAVEAIDAPRRDQTAVQDHETGQILALASQSITDPGTMTRPPLQAAAGMHEVVGGRVLGEVRDHRPDDRQVVDALADMRKQVADRDAALAVVPEFPGAAEHVADIVELRRMGLDLDRLPVLAVETRLGIKRVHLRWPAVHEQEDHARRLGREVRRLGRERVRRRASMRRDCFRRRVADRRRKPASA